MHSFGFHRIKEKPWNAHKKNRNKFMQIKVDNPSKAIQIKAIQTGFLDQE